MFMFKFKEVSFLCLILFSRGANAGRVILINNYKEAVKFARKKSDASQKLVVEPKGLLVVEVDTAQGQDVHVVDESCGRLRAKKHYCTIELPGNDNYVIFIKDFYGAKGRFGHLKSFVGMDKRSCSNELFIVRDQGIFEAAKSVNRINDIEDKLGQIRCEFHGVLASKLRMGREEISTFKKWHIWIDSCIEKIALLNRYLSKYGVVPIVVHSDLLDELNTLKKSIGRYITKPLNLPKSDKSSPVAAAEK